MAEDYTTEILSVSDLHSPVIDDDDCIIVNVDTRDFTLGKIPTTIGVVGDHNSNMVSFKIDRYIENHDISECSKHYLIWRNKSTKRKGRYYITSITVNEEDDTVVLGWLISGEVTLDAGEIEYCLKIADYDENDTMLYKWNTKWGGKLYIEDGEVDEEYTKSIPQSYACLVDQTTGSSYKIYVSNGSLLLEELEG